MTNRVRTQVGAALALMLACGTVFLATPATAVPVMGVSVNLILPSTTVVAGSTLHASLVITNDSGHPVYYGKNCRDDGVAVGLSSKAEPFVPRWTSSSCAGQLLVNTRRVLAVSISTMGAPCFTGQACLGIHASPLPAGIYNTQMYFRGFPSIGLGTPAQPLIVTVTNANSTVSTGTIVGRFLFSPAIATGPDSPIPGTITITPEHTVSSRKAVVIKVGKSGNFETHLAPGAWVVTGQSPAFQGDSGPANCRASSASVVRSNQITKVSVVCVAI